VVVLLTPGDVALDCVVDGLVVNRATSGTLKLLQVKVKGWTRDHGDGPSFVVHRRPGVGQEGRSGAPDYDDRMHIHV
jgi:hypothetical protein